MENTLYYGDNLPILREHIPDNSIDLIYLDPPFSSNKAYNILFKEPTGELSKAQITAFDDTWHWTEETAKTFDEIITTAPPKIAEMMRAFKDFIGINDVMAYLTMMCIRLIELRRVLKDTGSIYLHCDPTASHYLKLLMDAIFKKENFRNEIIWHYQRWPAKQKNFQRMHDVILFYSNIYRQNTFNCLLEPLSTGTLKRWKGRKSRVEFEGNIRLVTKMTDEESPGRPVDDVWNIPVINSQAQERLGYPTQKPLALLKRIIQASSNPNDLLLDPFCGCGTATIAAHKLGRRWIGIDITHLAINVIKLRLKNTFGLIPKRDYLVIGEPEDLAGATELATQNRYQFQWWASSLIGAHPYGDKKKGADTGIDAIFYFSDVKGKSNKVIVQVKSGKVGVKDIRDLGHVIDREKAEIGIFITLEPPTKDMNTEATSKGFYTSPLDGRKHLRIQIKTIEELLENSYLSIDIYRPTMFKKAEGISKEQFKLNV